MRKGSRISAAGMVPGTMLLSQVAVGAIALYRKNSQNRSIGFARFPMKTMSAKAAKNGFGLLLDTARAEPVTIEKHGRAVAVVIAIEEYQRLLKLSKRTRAAAQKPRPTRMNK